MSTPKKSGVKHLQDHASEYDLYFTLKQFESFRTWSVKGLCGRSRDDYYKGFSFDNPGPLPEPFRKVFITHSRDNKYTVFLGDLPIAWYNVQIGWVAPKLDGFSTIEARNEYEKAHNAVLAITGKGALT